MFKVVDEAYAYWLGFLYADGCIYSKRNGLELGIIKTDSDHIDKFSRYMGGGHIRFKENMCVYYSYDKVLVEHIKSIGIVPRKTWQDDSKILLDIPKELRRHFIRGFFDGDGDIGLYTNQSACIRFTSGNKSLLTAISEDLHENVGYLGVVYKDYKGSFYRLRTQGNHTIYRIGSYMYTDSSIYLQRKKIIYDRLKVKKSLSTDQLHEIQRSKLSVCKLSILYSIPKQVVTAIKKGTKTHYDKYELAPEVAPVNQYIQ